MKTIKYTVTGLFVIAILLFLAYLIFQYEFVVYAFIGLAGGIAILITACVHCGMCTDSCHYVLSNPGDPTFAPAYKADKIRKLFKHHYDWTGKVFPKWVKAGSVFTDEELHELKDIVFGKCTNCRRCTVNCPMGVDLATFNRMARGLLCYVGIMPEGVEYVAKEQWEIGNQMGVLKEDYIETIEWQEEDLQSEMEDPTAKIPIDKPDSNIVYVINPREIKHDPRSILDAAKIFYADDLGTWTGISLKPT